MRIVQLSDTHLTALGGITSANFEQIVTFVNQQLRPDLVVNTGDTILLSPDREADRSASKALHDRFDAPVRVVPGNHDVGEPGSTPWMGLSVTSERVARFREAFGGDRFVDELGEWAVVGIDSELLGSGLPEEAEQWEWLAEVGRANGGRPVALFLHKPLWWDGPAVADHALAVDEADRDRIVSLLAGCPLKVVGSGHLHRYLATWRTDDLLAVWAPSTAFVVAAKEWRLGGLNQLGVVEYDLSTSEPQAWFRALPTLVEEEPFSLAEFTEVMSEVERTIAEGGPRSARAAVPSLGAAPPVRAGAQP